MYRPFRITCQGVYMSGESKFLTKRIHSESESAQFMRQIGMKVPKSLVYYPKPVDLILGKVKCQ